MRLVINHLTRMDAPRICVAGIDPTTGLHVRPITARSTPLTRDLLANEGGPFALGMLIELGDLSRVPSPPETEDHLFRPNQTRVIGQLSSARYLELLGRHARESVHAIFGTELVRHGWNYAVDRDRGSSSLGILRVRRRSDLTIDRYGKLRLRIHIERQPAFLPVTDVRFVEADHRTIRSDVLDDVRTRMRRGVSVMLMLGLARAFAKPGDDHQRHWLQVNGVCMADRPLGDSP